MEKITTYEGAQGRLHRCPWNAAIDIIKSASEIDIKCVTDDPPRNQIVRDVIIWMADEIRNNDAQLKKDRAKKRGNKRR